MKQHVNYLNQPSLIGMLLQTKRFKHIVNKPTWL